MDERSHKVTAEDLRRLAAVPDRASLFRDCGTLIDCEDGITAVPRSVVSGTLSGATRYKWFRLLYWRDLFIEDGIAIGKNPRTIDGSDLDTKLAAIAAAINEPPGGAASTGVRTGGPDAGTSEKTAQ